MGPYRKRYGRDIFICPSVWYNDEYDALIGNKTHDVVGPDELSDNIISSEIPDDGDELFDANEFLDLNQGPDPDMGFNLQTRQD